MHTAEKAERDGRSTSSPYFSTRKLPITSASMPELKNVRIASVGVCTIASPRRLNEVFMTTARRCGLPNSSMSLQIERIDLFFDGLRPRAAVHVRSRRNHAALFRPHLRRHNHERRVRRAFQVFARRLLFKRRRERPPPLPKFHRIVDLGVHFRIARSARIERFPSARGQTPCALETTREFFRSRAVPQRGSRIRHARITQLIGLQCALDGAVVERTAPNTRAASL